MLEIKTVVFVGLIVLFGQSFILFNVFLQILSNIEHFASEILGKNWKPFCYILVLPCLGSPNSVCQSGIMYLVSCTQYPVSFIQYSGSSILDPGSSIQYQSSIQYSVSSILYPGSSINPVSCILYHVPSIQYPCIQNPTSSIMHPVCIYVWSQFFTDWFLHEQRTIYEILMFFFQKCDFFQILYWLYRFFKKMYGFF